MENRLHKDDIDAIVHGVVEKGINSLCKHYCRFSSIKTEDMETIVPFMLSFKGITEKTGMMIWKIFVGIIVMGVAGLTGLGFWAKLKGD
jgi:hypothetical protein